MVPSDRDNKTNVIIRLWERFVERLKRNFSNVNKKRVARQQLLRIRQKKSIVNYIVDF